MVMIGDKMTGYLAGGTYSKYVKPGNKLFMENAIGFSRELLEMPQVVRVAVQYNGKTYMSPKEDVLTRGTERRFRTFEKQVFLSLDKFQTIMEHTT